MTVTLLALIPGMFPLWNELFSRKEWTPHSHSFHQNSRNTPQITYSGYLMKRSNHPLLPLCDVSADIIVDDAATSPTIATEDDDTQQLLLPTHKPTIHDDKQVRVIHSANLMASFFGMLPLREVDVTAQQESSKRSQIHNKSTTHKKITSIRLIPPTIQPIYKSAPISFSPQKQPQRNTTNIFADATQTRLPPPPPNVIDKDGHIWRAKYCILQDGMLYFYNNMTDATCDDATIERWNKSTLATVGLIGNGMYLDTSIKEPQVAPILVIGLIGNAAFSADCCASWSSHRSSWSDLLETSNLIKKLRSP